MIPFLNILGLDHKYELKNERGVQHIVGRKVQGVHIQYPIDIDDKTLSRKHCEIKIKVSPKGLGYLLTDLASANGTWLYRGSIKIQIFPEDWVYLVEEDIIQMGNIKMKFEVPRPTSIIA